MRRYQYPTLEALRRKPRSTADLMRITGCLRPASVIHYLRCKGYCIDTIPSGPARMALYVLR